MQIFSERCSLFEVKVTDLIVSTKAQDLRHYCSKCRYVNDNYNYNHNEWYCSAVREHLQNDDLVYNEFWFFCNLYIAAQSMLIVESMHFWSNLVPRWVPWLKKTLAARWMTLPQFCSREKTGHSLKALFNNCFSQGPENVSGPKTPSQNSNPLVLKTSSFNMS